jgi:hypothetical protein
MISDVFMLKTEMEDLRDTIEYWEVNQEINAKLFFEKIKNLERSVEHLQKWAEKLDDHLIELRRKMKRGARQ